MLIQSQIKRAFWRNIALGTLPDLLIAAAAAYYFDSGLLGFVAVYLGLQAIYLAIWIKNALWGWGLFTLFGKKETTGNILATLREKRFPEPDNYIIDVEDYFLRVARMKDVSDEVRIEAVNMAGLVEYAKATGQMGRALQFAVTLEGAVKAYKASFPATAGVE